MFRASIRFKPVWEAWRKQLFQVTQESASLVEVNSGKLSPSFWDSPPIVSNLFDAFEGSANWTRCQSATAEARNELSRLAGTQRLTFESTRKTAGQKVAYNIFKQVVFPSDLHGILIRRLMFSDTYKRSRRDTTAKRLVRPLRFFLVFKKSRNFQKRAYTHFKK